MTKSLNCLAISPGLAHGALWRSPSLDVTQLAESDTTAVLTKEDRTHELVAFQAACTRVANSYLKRLADDDLTEDEQGILAAHQAMLADPELTEAISTRIHDGETALTAIANGAGELADLLAELDDEYLRERAQDVRDIASQLQKALTAEAYDLTALRGKIAILDEWLASEVRDFAKAGVVGVIAAVGGKTAHAAILAKSYGVPYVSGAPLELLKKLNAHHALLDGQTGQVIFDPDEATVAEWDVRQAKARAEQAMLDSLKGSPSISIDGTKRLVCGNIAGPDDVADILAAGAEGIALYRTEFLFLSKTALPTETELFDEYNRVFSMMGDRPVTIRTLDIGGDKGSQALPVPAEANPFLGVRGIRLSRIYPEVLRMQLRAILRAAHGHDVSIMFPMVTNLEDVLAAKTTLNLAMTELRSEGVAFNETTPFGIMVEVPAVAMALSVFAPHIDFISIGTNDLIQYTLAADRMNGGVQTYYDPFHPGLLRLVALCVKDAKSFGIEVAMCGDLAGDYLFTPLWNALGIDDYGVVASNITRIRHRITKSRSADDNLIEYVLSSTSAQEAKQRLTEIYEKNS